MREEFPQTIPSSKINFRKQGSLLHFNSLDRQKYMRIIFCKFPEKEILRKTLNLSWALVLKFFHVGAHLMEEAQRDTQGQTER